MDNSTAADTALARDSYDQMAPSDVLTDILRHGAQQTLATVIEDDRRFRFTSKILPPYLRGTKAIDELVPWLYLKGISTGVCGIGEPRAAAAAWPA